MTHEAASHRSPAEIADLYFDCWSAGDPEPLRSMLDPHVTFDGVLGSTRGPEEFLAGLAGMFAATVSNQVLVRLASDTDVMTWSELTLVGKAPTQVVNWTHVKRGMIETVRVVFDPRAIITGE